MLGELLRGFAKPMKVRAALLVFWVGLLLSWTGGLAATAGNDPPGRRLLSGTVQMVLVTYPPHITNSSSGWSISWSALDGNGNDCPSCAAFCTLNGVDQHCDVLKEAPTPGANGAYVSSKALSPASEDGTYVLQLWGQEPNCGSACVNGSVAQVSWTLHTEPPTVTISGGPANQSITSLQTVVIPFTVTDALSTTVVCALDSAPFTDCTSAHNGVSLTGLTAGTHFFRVRATDAAGNVGSIAFLSWTVDLTTPTVTILQRPPAVSNFSTASFRFQGAIAGSVTRCATCAAACALDGAAALPCALAPGVVTYPGLVQGAHNVSVTVTDPDGNLRTVTTVSWTVDLTGPVATVIAMPNTRTTEGAAAFGFACTDNYDVTCANATFLCQLDALPAQACTPALGAKYAGLGVAGKTTGHTFAVVPTDQAGNVGAPATFNWTVDLINPTLTFIAQPLTLVNSTRAFFAFAANDSTPTCVTCTYTCQLDKNPPESCSTGGSGGQMTCTGLSDGAHEIVVTVTNPVGLTAVRRGVWTVDTATPLATIDLGASPTNRNPMSVRVIFSKPCANFGNLGCGNVSSTSPNATCGAGLNITATTLAKISVNKATVVANSARVLSARELSLNLVPAASGNYDVTLTLASGTCMDFAGNVSPAAAGNVTFNDVRGVPVLASDVTGILSVIGNQSYIIRRTNAGELNFTVDFGNPVTGFSAKGINVVGGTVGKVVPYIDPGSGAPAVGEVYSFSVIVTADGWVRVAIADSAGTDGNGNPSLPSEILSVQVDREPPAFTLTSLVGYKTKDVSMGVLILVSEVLDEPVLAQFLNVSNANMTSFAGDGGTYGLRVEALPGQLVSVNVPAGVVRDRAGNWNRGSDVLTIQHYVVPPAIAAAATTATTAVVSTGAVSTGASVAGSLGGAGMTVSGNLVGLFTVIQRFAMIHHLAIKQSVTLTEMTGSFKWANLDAVLPFGLGLASEPPNGTTSFFAAAPAPAPDAAARRRLLTSKGDAADVADAVQNEDNNRQSAAKSLVSSVIGKVDQGWSTFDRVLGWSLLIVFGSTALHMIAVRLWRMWTEQTIPDVLMFPRCEILVIMLTVEGLAQACGLLISGGTANGRLVGTLIFICVPGSIVAFFFYIVLYKIYKSQAASFVETPAEPPKGANLETSRRSSSMAPTVTKRGAILGRVAAAASLGNFSKPVEGKWEDGNDKHFVARYGVFFQSYRGFAAAQAPEEKPFPNERARGSAKKRPRRTWGQYLAYHGLGADKFRSCYFSVYLFKKMLFGLLFGLYGGHESWTQVILLFSYSCFQLTYLMVFKPYLDRAIQAVEEIVLICETVSFLLALLVLWRGSSGWATARLSDSALQSLLLSAQLLSILMQLVHQWYSIFGTIYKQRATVFAKLRGVFRKKADAGETAHETSKSLRRKRTGKTSRLNSRRRSPRGNQEDPGEADRSSADSAEGDGPEPQEEAQPGRGSIGRLPERISSAGTFIERSSSGRHVDRNSNGRNSDRRSNGQHSERSSIGRHSGRNSVVRLAFTEGEEYGGSGLPKSRDSVESQRSARQAAALRRRSSRELDVTETEGLPRNRRGSSWTDARERNGTAAAAYDSRRSTIALANRRAAFGDDQRERTPSLPSPARSVDGRDRVKSDETPNRSPISNQSIEASRRVAVSESEPGWSPEQIYRGSPMRKVPSYEGEFTSASVGGSPRGTPTHMRKLSSQSVDITERSPRSARRGTMSNVVTQSFTQGDSPRRAAARRGTVSNLSNPRSFAAHESPRRSPAHRGSISNLSNQSQAAPGGFDESEMPSRSPARRGTISNVSYASSPGDIPRRESLRGSPERRGTISNHPTHTSRRGLPEEGSPRKPPGRRGTINIVTNQSSPGEFTEEESPRRQPPRRGTISNVSYGSSTGDSPRRPAARRLAMTQLSEDPAADSNDDGQEYGREESPGAGRVAPVVKASLATLKKKAAEGRTVSRARSRLDVDEPVYEWGGDEDDAELDRPAFMKPQYYV